MRPGRKPKPIPPEVVKARRLALGAMIGEGGVPRPEQFRRAGLPVLVRASDLLAVESVTDAMDVERGARPRRRLPGPQF